MNKPNKVQFEFRHIYDGWIVEVEVKTGKITWRDIHIVDKIPEDEKKRIEQYVKRNLILTDNIEEE